MLTGTVHVIGVEEKGDTWNSLWMSIQDKEKIDTMLKYNTG